MQLVRVLELGGKETDASAEIAKQLIKTTLDGCAAAAHRFYEKRKEFTAARQCAEGRIAGRPPGPATLQRNFARDRLGQVGEPNPVLPVRSRRYIVVNLRYTMVSKSLAQRKRTRARRQ